MIIFFINSHSLIIKHLLITFTDNTFTIPEANVTIEATFTVKNSETNTSNLLIAVVSLIISCTIFYNLKKKAAWIEV